jgi:hypothetical protein
MISIAEEIAQKLDIKELIHNFAALRARTVKFFQFSFKAG